MANAKMIKYQNEFIKRKYDRINITFPLGKKEIYREHANNKHNMSLNALINHLLEKDMKEAGE